MRILHLMLACFYIDNYNYQENVLPRINKEDGHKVKIISSTETFVDNMNLGYIEPSTYINEDGIEVVRLQYKKYICPKVYTKIRSYVGLYREIESFNPDIIFCHGIQFKDLDVITEYKKAHTNVKIYADSHEDIHNSARSFLAKNILYKRFYNPIIKRNLASIEKIFCVSKEAIDFMTDICRVPKENLSFFPLGGVIDSEEIYIKKRKEYRDYLNVKNDDIVVVHSGKLDNNKKTVDLVKSFSAIENKKLKLVIIGKMLQDIKEELNTLISKDERIIFLGWRNATELMGYLTAADMYAQPGTQSATMQNAACACNAMMLYPYDSHKYIFGKNALYVETSEDMKRVFYGISNNEIDVEKIKEECFSISKEILDYRKMIQQIY